MLHALEGKALFSPQTMKEIAKLRDLDGLTADSHQLEEREP